MTFELEPGEVVVLDILDERERQVAKGYTPEHDDKHGVQHLVAFAKERLWGWGEGPTDEFVRGELIAAGALIVAAVESIDRAVAKRAEVSST